MREERAIMRLKQLEEGHNNDLESKPKQKRKKKSKNKWGNIKNSLNAVDSGSDMAKVVMKRME